jgi:aminoglycoside phosphotransferase family enzyme
MTQGRRTPRPDGLRPGGVPPLVEVMMRPGFYPASPGHVELKQTHISYVFLAGDYVYKVKKPVHFPFLDC